ncbi:MAG: ArsC/Spx/MgsR family protein [Spirochaetota bacterium]
MALQIFGTHKCPDTRKAERFFKERDIPYHFVDLADKGISSGELAVLRKAIGVDALMDSSSKHYKDRGLAYMEFDVEEEILADPLLLRTPVVRNGPRAVVGHDPAGWANLTAEH